MQKNLSEKWIKASIAGTIWAASEIVLGSFLHNLKIPFSGNILTAIGIILLISISYVWSDRGIFWRAGLICAVMKTMSPSAVIFGPMVAIIAESLLLETSVMVFGRTIAGFLIGSIFAMSWNLFQKIINFIIFYGSNIIEVYSNLLKYAQKQLELNSDIVWLPIIILLALYAIFGLLAGIIGIRVGRKLLKEPQQMQSAYNNNGRNKANDTSNHDFNYSIVWLFMNIVLIIGLFILLNLASWIIWTLAITIVILVWSYRYKRALRQLSKPKFWIFFVLITLITAFALTDTAAGESLLEKGLLTGIQMNFRAVVIIVGFSVLGKELYNPGVRSFFRRTSFRNLPLAIELSVESLPDFIASIPDFRSLVKNPVSIFHQVILHADRRLSEITMKDNTSRKVFILTGSIGSGKTSFARMLVRSFNTQGITAKGILTEKIKVNNITRGYDIINIETGERTVFLRDDGICGTERIGRYLICQDGIDAGEYILNSFEGSRNNAIIIDEVGSLELNEKGWAKSIKTILEKSENHLIMTVRTPFLDDVIKKWGLSDSVVINVSDIDYNEKGLDIVKAINGSISK
ncbi:MAG TPA: nucleoside-triphosphatase [Bacteroidales bacterium]|nr:nucleoside-triphosphatase [Bacteroidales bacterium]